MRKTSNIYRPIFTAALVMSILSLNTTRACDEEQAKYNCGQRTAWHQGNHIVLEIRDPQKDSRQHLEWFIYESGDVLIKKNEHYNGINSLGKIGIVSGRKMITNGLELQKGYEIDAVDGPALMMQLLIRLLDEGRPEGPRTVKTNVDINHMETTNSIRVATTAASGEFGVPWKVNGSLSPGKGGAIEYELDFISEVSSGNYRLIMSGRWQIEKTLKSLDDSMSLVGWKIYEIGPIKKVYDGGTIFDYGARPIAKSYEDMGELKSVIESEENAVNQSDQASASR